MGLREAFAALTDRTTNGISIEYRDTFVDYLRGMSPADLYRSQPYVRIVVSFLARNISQLGLHTFERVSDTDRRRVTDDNLARLLKSPNPSTTTYELVYGLVGDLALYDEHHMILREDQNATSGWQLQPIPSAWIVGRGGGDAFSSEWIEFQRPTQAQPFRVDTKDLLSFKGWDPVAPRHGSSPIESLKHVLEEQYSATAFRKQMWARGGRFGGFLTRPVGAKWDKDTREKFSRDWKSKYTDNDGANAGGTPILEDGMEYKTNRFSAQEEEYIAGAKLALNTVAAAYHVNPTMIGVLDNANFSNVREFRKMLYGDTLGSTIAMLEDRINTFLVPRVAQRQDLYVEFNIAEKLQGSFDEQAAAISSSTGRPWMTANEARALQNLPALDGDASQLVTPLNVLVGGQASPRDSAPKNIGEIRAIKAPTVSVKVDDQELDGYRAKAEEVLRDFYKRQRQVVLSKLGAKAAGDYFDSARWDKELADDIYALAVKVAGELGRGQAKSLGFAEGDYDEDRTLQFLRRVAESRAGAVNATTLDRIEKALAEDADPAQVFDEAESARVSTGAAALIAALAGFALVESGKQLVGDRATKTWIVNSRSPRPSHARMDGQTVGIDDNFSNGAHWPGDPVLGAEGNSNCLCSVQIDF
jgi:HK97 family phage portal protein